MTPAIRTVTPADLPGARAVIGANGLFPPEMLDGMIGGFLSGTADEVWLTIGSDADAVAGLVYAAPERLTDGTWNALLLAVHPEHQRRGLGAALMHAAEAMLAARGARLLLVETSGLPDFDGTRRFYARIGYGEEARIRGFYAAGEDKIVFRKPLPPS